MKKTSGIYFLDPNFLHRAAPRIRPSSSKMQKTTSRTTQIQESTRNLRGETRISFDFESFSQF
jgi:hypothetical protein